MVTIYEPRGRAKEYADLALNLYSGCSSGCLYCWAPQILRKTREEFKNVQPRTGILDYLRHDAPKYAGQTVLLSFSCDPYPPLEPTEELTRQAISILHHFNVGVRILTKGGLRSTRDSDMLGPLDSYGATLTFCTISQGEEWEPGAPSWLERIAALQEAHDRGIWTWVSLEPVIEPEQTIELISITSNYVDEYRIGKWNHDYRAKFIDWKKFAHQAKATCEAMGKRYMMKEDLKVYL